MCHTALKFQRTYILHNWFVLKATAIPTSFWLMIALFLSIVLPIEGNLRPQTLSHCFFCWNTVLFPHMNQTQQHSNQDHPQEICPHTCTAYTYPSGPISKTYCTLSSYNAVTEQIKARKCPLMYKTLKYNMVSLKVQEEPTKN